MRCNADTVLVTPDVRLVPYRPEHVATYHGWMQDAELLRLTASERLDAAEEAANQASWAADASKGTFIILEGGRDGSYAAAAPPMVGDVNFYLLPAGGGGGGSSSSEGEGEGEGGEGGARLPPPLTAEIEVMVAEPSARRRGVATTAVRAAMAYAAAVVGVRVFVAKVFADNAPSLALFRRLGFGHERPVAAFGEVHLRLTVGVTEVGGTPPALPPTLSYDAEVARWQRRRAGEGGGGGPTVVRGGKEGAAC